MLVLHRFENDGITNPSSGEHREKNHFYIEGIRYMTRELKVIFFQTYPKISLRLFTVEKTY